MAVQEELVLLDGWDLATSLNSTGALIWSSFDGQASLQDIATDLATASGLDQNRLLVDLVQFVGDLARRGLLAGLEPEIDHHGLQLEVVPPHYLGDAVDDLELHDLDGKERRLRDLTPHGDLLLVNWNPHCGYCARIAGELAALREDLEAAACGLALVATGSAEANRSVAAAAGLDVPILLLEPGQDPFRSAGTPTAYHLDTTGRIVSPPAYGADQVPSLARSVAGVDPQASSDPPTDQVRYLLEDDGSCAPTWNPDVMPGWAGTRVYEMSGYHVGIRYDSPTTASVLDHLFAGRRVDDPRAGHTFSVALGLSPTDTQGNARNLNLLVQAGQPTLRSRDPGRVLRALLWQISAATMDLDLPGGQLQVDAIAVVDERGAALLPWNLHAFAPRLQPLLARNGLAMADLRHPQIDLATAELVIPEPAVAHDPSVLEDLSVTLASTAERPSVRPGRYPLTTWCTIYPNAPRPVTRFSPAEAAAATLSSVLHTDDAPERVRQLARLHGRVDGVGIWYYFESDLVATLVEALQADTS